jgi:hypothetical protein
MLRPRPARSLAAVALLLVLAGGAACSSDGGDDASSASPESFAADEAGGNGGERGVETAASSGAPALVVDPAQAKVPDDGRDVVYTARVELRVRDVDDALRDASRSVRAAGGTLFRQRSDLGRAPTVTVTYKVPPERFEDALAAIADLGRVRNRKVDATDVTGRVVDLDARIRSNRTSVERLRALLAESGSVGDLLTVERELATREANLEALEGQLASLRARVDRATVTAVFSRIPKPAAAKPESPTKLPGFLSGLETGAGAFVNTVTVVSGVVGFALPFLALAAVLAIPFFAVRRRQRHAGA